jgi:hypothetical protein
MITTYIFWDFSMLDLFFGENMPITKENKLNFGVSIAN